MHDRCSIVYCYMIFIEEIVYCVAKDRFLGGGNTTCLCRRVHACY